MKRTMTALALVGVTMIGLVGTSPTASAATAGRQKVGYTRVAVDSAVVSVLSSAGITPAPTNGAKAELYNGTLAAKFLITSTAKKGKKLSHKGGVSLTAGAKQIVLRSLVVNLKKGTVTAKASGSVVGNAGRVQVFSVVPSTRPDLGKVGLALTSTAAEALDATFGTTAFKAGQVFGYATPKPHAKF